MKNKEELVKEYLTTITHRLSADYGLSLDDAAKAVESLDLFNIYEGDYDFLLHEDISTWVNIAYDNYRLKFNRPLFLTPTLKQAIKDIEKHTEINNNYLKEEKKVLKEFIPDRMDVQTYNKVFLPQWTMASLFIRNLQLTLEGKCDKESLRQLQIIGWNEETKKFILDVLNLYKENVLNELRDISNKPEKKKENTMENYIVINGKKAELTEEQLKQLGIEIEKKRNNPFNDQSKADNVFYHITSNGITLNDDNDYNYNVAMITAANSFNDVIFVRQLYLHELLNRKLLKYAYDNEAEDVEWDCNSKQHYYIFFDYSDKVFSIATGISIYKNEGSVYFSKQEVAENAIEDIVKPFMEEHPEFVW